MTRAIRLRRAIIATLILAATLSALPLAGQASAMPTVANRESVTIATADAASATGRICPIQWRKGPYYVKKLIRCTARFYGVSIDKALYVAYRESKYYPRAFNEWSCAKGIYQHLCRYWPTRADTFGFDDWSAFNARANIIVSMRMVKRYGWSPWGG